VSDEPQAPTELYQENSRIVKTPIMAVQPIFNALTSGTIHLRSSTKKWQTPDRFILVCSTPRGLASRNIAMIVTPRVASAFGASAPTREPGLDRKAVDG
jgi:hypothetical protein